MLAKQKNVATQEPGEAANPMPRTPLAMTLLIAGALDSEHNWTDSRASPNARRKWLLHSTRCTGWATTSLSSMPAASLSR